jgi:hypothetical protein
VILIVLGAIAVIAIDILISLEFYKIAEMKGHPERKYLWLSVLLGIIGYLLVVALPDRRQDAAVQPIPTDDLPEI